MAREELKSEALRINLETTRVAVHIDPKYEAMRTVVLDYVGLLQQTENLLAELNHPYRNWDFVVGEMRRYGLQNFPIYLAHSQGPQVCRLVAGVFMEAIREGNRPAVQGQAANNLILFLQHLAREVESIPQEYVRVLNEIFVEMVNMREGEFFFLVSSFHSLKKITALLSLSQQTGLDFTSYCSLLKKALCSTYQYWLRQEDPREWFQDQAIDWCRSDTHNQYFHPLAHESLRGLNEEVEKITKGAANGDLARVLSEFPDFMDIVNHYRKLPELLGQQDPYVKVLMLYKIVETKGLRSIHEEAFREIDRTVGQIIQRESPERLISFLSRTFAVFARGKKLYPQNILSCVLTVGKEIIKTSIPRLINHYLDSAISLGFELPQAGGVNEDWQVLINPAHLPNIRVWLELIETDPKQNSRLLSALLVNLSLGGVYIQDTDLFQKDISRLLNSPILPVYSLVKQLAKTFPVYFNEIGAEGLLRDVSTEIDELSHRQDRLIHFLRKQSHVESNPLLLNFIRQIIRFWCIGDKALLRVFLPEEVFQQVSVSGPFFEEIQQICQFLMKENSLRDEKELLELDLSQVEMQLAKMSQVSEQEKKRTLLLIRFHRLLAEKYELNAREIRSHLERGERIGMPNPDSLIKALEETDIYAKLHAILSYLQSLKDIILSEQESIGVENIYRKRHIAANIPSMYGSYNEPKFDALGLSLRLETLANTLFEESVAQMNLGIVTRAAIVQINKYLVLFVGALEIEGITSKRLKKQLGLLAEALKIRRFSYSQYIDIFKGFSEAIKAIINHYCHDLHYDNLQLIISQIGPQQLLAKYQRGKKTQSQTEFINKVAETFLRNLVAGILGLQCFDTFVSRVLNTLIKQRQVLSSGHLDLLMSYDPNQAISRIHQPNPLTQDLIHLGNKGYNLVLLAEQGIAVPPGFIVTTEFFRCHQVCREYGASDQDFLHRVDEHKAYLEEATGCILGSPSRPLLLSARSGAAVSMPGMMNTLLNLGINQEVVEGLIQQTGEPWFAWDCYRRFLQSWGMAFDIERDTFDAIMNTHKARYNRQLKREFSTEEIRQLVDNYRQVLADRGVSVPDDLDEQLRVAIFQVMRSWYSKKAKNYREIMGISDNWGTAVTVQAMVYGNLDINSGSGVALTHNPRRTDDQISLWGDFTLGNQGEDVVGGLVKTLPLSEEQRREEGRKEPISLEGQFPQIFSRLRQIAEKLIYEQGWGPQEMEFTFQSNTEEELFILQVRDMTLRVRRSYSVFTPSIKQDKAYLASGIGVSGGALSGRAVFNLKEIEYYRRQYPGDPLILIRSDTVPDDIKEISAADAILSARGGTTSHAAIVAYQLEKTSVVGCMELQVWERESCCFIGGHEIRAGDLLSIDGRSGSVHHGRYPIKTVEVYQ
ncbi:MAG: PEP/pyruvate-binding domain-containing protein [Deltaproteobacteria bacterium]